MLLDRPERIAFKVDEALVLLEYRNLKDKDNRYLQDSAGQINMRVLGDHDDKDNITIVMKMYQKAMEALILHREKKEQVISENTNKTPIITPDELREDMYR